MLLRGIIMRRLFPKRILCYKRQEGRGDKDHFVSLPNFSLLSSSPLESVEAMICDLKLHSLQYSIQGKLFIPCLYFITLDLCAICT